MLIQFRFNNFKCFKGETLLSMLASDKIHHSTEAIIQQSEYNLLKMVAVYGANASGKTKLFQAYYFMERMVCELANENKSNWQERYMPFVLSEETDVVNSSFEVIFVINGIVFRYGFTINDKVVLEEWLYRTNNNKEVEVFYRDTEGIDYNRVFINRTIAEPLIDKKMIRVDTLFLTVLATWNHPLSKRIVNWFFNTNVLSATNRMTEFSLRCITDTVKKEQVLRFIRSADINIEDLSLREADITEFPEEIRKMILTKSGGEQRKFFDGVVTKHKVFDKNGLPFRTERLSLEEDESYGTYRLFALSAPIIDTLENGKILWIDEIDNGLHPNLIKILVSLFVSPTTNRHNAQLIINTHNIDLLDDKNIFQQDQVYIVNKNRYGEATLLPLLSFIIDDNKTMGQLYREGRFGGIPYLNDFVKFMLN